METALALAGYAAVLAVLGPRWLATARWADRAPRLAIAAWQAVCASVVLAVVLAGLALTVSSIEIGGRMFCAVRCAPGYATPGGTTAALLGGGLALAVAARLAACLTATLYRTARQRHHQLDAIALLAHRAPTPDGAAHLSPTGPAPDAAARLSRAGPGLDAVLVDHPTPVAYCLPGRGRRVVLSTAALAVLDDARLAAVLAHERAHLRHRHDLVIAVATAFGRAFPYVPVLRQARAHVVRLVELAADDAAGRTADRLTVADAILSLAHRPAPAPALAAAATAAGQRVRRLLAPHRPLPRLQAVFGAAAVAAVLLAPAAVATEPGIAAAATCAQTCVMEHRS